jgi:NAD(P)-dependent dehydrogenase (short-subunit alcohol dehydrogenase family)
MLTDKLKKLGLSDSSLKGRVTVISGAGRGIGKELAIALSRIGASVVIAELSDSGADVEALIRSAGGSAIFVKTDVSDEASVKALYEKAVKAFGKVDILVNNAIVVTTGPVLEQPINSWDKVFAVNLRGPVLMIKAFLPGMLERKEGVIANVLSSEGMSFLAPYSASKAALQSLTSSLVGELGDGSGVAVFNFAPGMVDTPGLKAAVDAVAPRMGLTMEQFTHLGVNPGYEGLMPAEDCAAGFAYDIVHAKEFHGQSADAIRPFMQAGILAGKPASEGQAVPTPGRSPATRGTYELGKALQEVLESVNREIEELDLFRKTWMKNDFNRKAGMSIKDWRKTGQDIVSDLEELARSGKADGNGRARLAYAVGKLEVLADYFHSSKENAKGYIKDPAMLSAAMEALNHRENTARSLAKALKEL